ncbi:PRA1 family protein A1 [Glycine soja]
MDWGNVTAEDLIDALREVDWSSPPRPLSEFFSRFTVPRSSSKWNSRLKCNLYYYRTNYFILIVSVLILGFLRRPLAIVAALLTALNIAFLNDRGKVLYQSRTYAFDAIFSVNLTSVLVQQIVHGVSLGGDMLIRSLGFAGTFSEKVTRTVRQFSPHLAAKMRPPLTPVIRGRPSSKRAIYICGRPRWVFVLIFSSASFFLWFVSAGLLTVLWALAIGLLATILHASFRTPNLKARLNTFREEFRAVWRNYSEL